MKPTLKTRIKSKVRTIIEVTVTIPLFIRHIIAVYVRYVVNNKTLEETAKEYLKKKKHRYLGKSNFIVLV